MWLPNLIFDLMGFLSRGLVFVHLPETLEVALPETISEAEQFQADTQTRTLSIQSQDNMDENTPLLGSTA